MFDTLEGYIQPGTEEEALVKQIDFSKLPVHLAIIMDGNGRWARKRNLPRTEGHKAGTESVKEVIEASARLGLKYLTLYAFSRENWKRPKEEVNTLWNLLKEYLGRDSKILIDNNLKLKVIGEKKGIPYFVRRELNRVERLTRNNERMTVILALNYGGRQEIIETVKKLLKRKFSPEEINEEIFSRYLDTAGLPDPDLLIRTSGEMRLSNFLLWQCAYTELWITPTLWPDFRKKELFQAIIEYQKRERRFGGLDTQA
ncbi:MAG TPA: isoprenyl transferase [Candidatus Aminicenantes bacterium]|nr:MAG: isoprenyl transferase [Candidatus Aminicenantes bacterium]HEK84944.1 isoprenyl transferase [Candidatus Aminicenantes bacterium]